MRLILAACLLASASSTIAAPKPVGTSSPDLVIVRKQPNGLREVVLANEDGSGARAIYTSSVQGIVLRAGPASQRTILMTEGTKLSLLKYRVGATGVELETSTVLPVSGASADISPDGTLVAYSDVGTRSYQSFRLSDGAITPIAKLADDESFAGARFSRDGTALVYRASVVASSSSRMYKVALASGSIPANLGINDKVTDFNLGLDNSIYASHSDGSGGYVIDRWTADGTSWSRVTTGNRPTLSCTDRSMMFQLYSGTTPSVLRRDLATGLQYTFSQSGYYYGPQYLGCN